MRVKELYNVFKEFNDIDEVIIPPKRDIRDKRYGFIRFFKVNDKRLLATKLDNIFLGNMKIEVYTPRFA